MSFSLRFVLRQTSKDAVFQHMALCSPTRQLMHWVLPGSALRLLDGTPYYLLCEAPTADSLPHVEVDTGECTVTQLQEKSPAEALHHHIQAGLVQLHLQGRNLTGDFTLARLSPEGHIWRFSMGHSVSYRSVLNL